MKNQQNNASALSALLRTANGGDTLEINSLCCAAAGIIDPLSATAEALIPHEKLRGAALSDATLTAPARPLAQPALGYKSKNRFLRKPHLRQFHRRHVDGLRIVRKRRNALQDINRRTVREQLCHYNTLFQCTPNNQKRLDHIGQRQIHRIDTAHSQRLFFNSRHNFSPRSAVVRLHSVEVLKQEATYGSSTLSNTTDESEYYFITVSPCFSDITSLFVRHDQGGYHGSQATDNLKPSRRVRLLENQDKSSYHRYSTDGRNKPHGQTAGIERETVGSHCQPSFPKIELSLPPLEGFVYGGAK
ncbi:hypothetical protein [Pseudomonas sp. 58 R 3]|nr:hypothetical protein [Pseudomonas sp. 58 R 3]